MKKLIISSIIPAAFAITSASAMTIFSESVDGSASADANSPTPLGTLALGQSDLIGTIGGGVRDHYTFTVASGQVLSGINLVSGTGNNHFFGLDDAATFSSVPASLLIAGLYSETDIGSDLLDVFSGGGAFGGQGITGSQLPAGDYTILINETAGATFDYQLGLTVVPEPSSTALAAVAGLGLLARRRR